MAQSHQTTTAERETRNQNDDEHQKLIKNTEGTLNSIFANDSLMRDLNFVELEEIREKLSVLKGKAICVNIDRGQHLPKFEILIPEHHSASVLCLKKAIARHWQQLERKRHREESDRTTIAPSAAPLISWKYIWRAYHLITCPGDKVLDTNDNLLSDYDIRHKSTLKFIKKSKWFARKLN